MKKFQPFKLRFLFMLLFTLFAINSCKKEVTVEKIDISGLWKSEDLNNIARIENSTKAVLFDAPDNLSYLYCAEVSTNKYSFGNMGYIEVIDANKIKVSGGIYDRVTYTINTNLKDYWVRDDDGLEICITDVSAVTTNVPTSSVWYYAIDAGLISKNTFKLKSISIIDTYLYVCRELWLNIVNGYPTDIGWSSDGTITMSNDGTAIYIKSTDPWSNNKVTSNYHRKGANN